MCGIFGFANLRGETLNEKELGILTRFLALENESRGRDSTGLGIINDLGQPMLIRKVEDASDFIKNDVVRAAINRGISRDVQQVFGHTRAATHGAVVLKNAQPFLIDKVLGVHNGIISNHAEVFKEIHTKPRTDCDSESIYAALSHGRPTMKAAAKELRRLNGYYSVAFHDFRTPGMIYFARYNNILTVWITKDRRFVIWSSQQAPLWRVEKMFGLDFLSVTVDDGYLVRIDTAGNIVKRFIRYPVTQWSSKDTTTPASGNGTGPRTYTPLTDYGAGYYGRGAGQSFHNRRWMDDALETACEICYEKPGYWDEKEQSYLCTVCLATVVSGSEGYGKHTPPAKQLPLPPAEDGTAQAG